MVSSRIPIDNLALKSKDTNKYNRVIQEKVTEVLFLTQGVKLLNPVVRPET